MSKLIEALRKKYKSPYAALAVLGLDASVLEDQTNEQHEKEPTMPYNFTVATRTRDVHFSRRKFALDYARRHRGVIMAFDAERDNSIPAEGQVDTLHADAQPELADYLRKFGWSDEDIEEACRIASETNRMSMDDPTDLAYGGEPRPGGSMTPLRRDGSGNTRTELQREAMDSHSHMIFKQNGVINSRNVALALASRIQRDNSVPTQFYTPPGQTKQARRQLASDASASHSSNALADFYSRFPDVARIGRA